MVVFAIDPGPNESAWVLWDGSFILGRAIEKNESLLLKIRCLMWPCVPDVLAIEEIRNTYGMPAGVDLLHTVFWVGRFYEAWSHTVSSPHCKAVLVPRLLVKTHLCRSARARDSNIRQALIDRFGPPGTKRKPGRTYGLKKDMWQAFGLAVYVYDRQSQQNQQNYEQEAALLVS